MNTYSPKQFRPMRNWVLVLAEPRKTVLASGILIAPNETGLEKVSTAAGRVFRIGRGDKIDHMNLKEGDRVIYRGFLKHANPIPHEETWEDGSSKEYFLMSSDDLMAVVPNDLDVSVFSGRPAVPERE